MTVTIDWLVRFLRPREVLELHDVPPGTDVVDARAFGLTAPELRRRRRANRGAVLAAARELADSPLPFRPGELVIGLGDSITADALSWFEIIAAVAWLQRRDVRFVNAAISGDTTADLRKRAFRLRDRRPDWILVMIGTNDCQRHGGELLVSLEETRRNLAALGRALQAPRRRVIWITPPAIAPSELAPLLAQRGLAFRSEDVAAVTDALHELFEDVIAVQRIAGDGLLEDGLHPTFAGQRRLAREILRALS